MSKIITTFVLLIFILVAVLVVSGLNSYVGDLPNNIDDQETIVLGQTKFVPGSQAALRVVVRNSKDATPLPGAKVKISFHSPGGKQMVVYNGSTDEEGNSNVSFQVPEVDQPDQTMVIEAKSRFGSDRVERPVRLERNYRVFLATDKPIYQPGQIIHLRALTLNTFDLSPAKSQELEFSISDCKGNRVFRKKLTTTEFGVAYTDFQLANEVNSGAYKITATLGNTTSEKTVTVEYYVLPKFKVQLTTERTYYQPGQIVRGTIQADYFFGKPVSMGGVTLEGYTFDVERTTVVNLQGVTNENGRFDFEFTLPSYIAGSDLEGGLGRFYLLASVTDQAKHIESINQSIPVSQNMIVIEAIPEGGILHPGVENLLYVMSSYPDGVPAETQLSIFFPDSGHTVRTETGKYGFAEVRFNPTNTGQMVRVDASDSQGNSSGRDFYFEGPYYEETILLRPDKPVYRVGESMILDILTSQEKGTAYLDILREGQTISTQAVDITSGHAQVGVDLSADMFGTLELHAYKILRSGSIVRDTRLVVVDYAQDLAVNINSICPDYARAASGECIFRPGEETTLELQVNDSNGGGVSSAIGLSIVDESVFALAEQDPGFAKLYFLLENEILQPRYDLHGFSIPSLLEGIPDDPVLEKSVADTAQASLSAASPIGSPFSMDVNSHAEAISRAYGLQSVYFGRMGTGMLVILFLICMGMLGISVVAAYRQRALTQGILTAAGIYGFVACLLAGLYYGFQGYGSFGGSLYNLTNLVMGGAATLLVLAFVSGLIGFLLLLSYAIVHKDSLMGWTLGLLALFIAAIVEVIYLNTGRGFSPSQGYVLLALGAFGLLPLVFLIRPYGFFKIRGFTPAVGTLLMGIFLLMWAVPTLAFSNGFMFGAMSAGVPPPGEIFVEEMDIAGRNMAIMPAAQPTQEVQVVEKQVTAQSSATPEPPRLRQYFPETMLWIPDGVTDHNGYLRMNFQVADSITTWRISTIASSQDGRLGSINTELRVFQDFFIDLDLPVALTQGDEVSIPVGIFNYLPEVQTVRLELAHDDWFELLDEAEKQVEIAPNEINVVYFHIRATGFGQYPLKVTAWGSNMSDAIQKEVRVYPNGKPISFTRSDRLKPDQPVREVISIPQDAIPGTQALVVKVYPGVLSQVVEGLDSILRMPSGCFEQTSSTTYPNVLVMDYLKSTNQASPETQMKAEEYINLGYQRLTTFEVDSTGGFSLFGDAPSDRMLTAYGLQEFTDMSKVYDVDPALIGRAAEWLLSQQESNGSWKNDQGLVHEATWQSLGDAQLPVTAYISWSLIEAGYAGDGRTQRGIDYVRENHAKADDAYVLGLVANALVAWDLENGDGMSPLTRDILDELAGMAVQEGNVVYWKSNVATFMGGENLTGSIETTALASLAFLTSQTHSDLANSALTYLIQQKDNFGTWYSTQATVLSLKALIESIRSGTENVDATLTLTLNGGQEKRLVVNKENYDVVQLLSFSDVLPGAENVVEISAAGEGNLMYQVSGSFYLPWGKIQDYSEWNVTEEPMKIEVTYERTELAVDDTVEVAVTITLQEEGSRVQSALIDLGLPPGFSVQLEDLAGLVEYYNDVPADYAFAKIERYELTGRQILIYATNLSYGNPLHFTYRLKAKFPLVAQTPSSSAYDYYNPDQSGEVQPEVLVVKE